MIIFWIMSDDSEILVDLLREVLGDEHLHYESKGQISFDCPVCDDDRHKGNLEINYFSHVYKCWSCGDVKGTHGPLGKLFDKYGNKSQKKVYKVLQPEEFKPQEVRKEKLRLPNEFKLFKDDSETHPIRRQAYTYLTNRGINNDIIEKYRIGFCSNGDFGGRVIVPSYTESGELNYFIARSWIPNTRAKYKNPEAEKDKIIFNESLINWNQDIFLVEGVFDGFFLPNSIAMLGKHMSEKLFDTIYQRAMGNIIIALDGDAWSNAVKLYHELNGGGLYGKIKILKLPEDKDVCDLRGEINDYYYNIKD
jgi:DNA primase